MIVVNCLLIRYATGHVYVDRADGHRRREQYVELDGVRDRDHARAIGLEILALAKSSRLTDVREGDVRQIDQLPGIGFQLGDKIDGAMLSAITVRMVRDGDVQVIHEVDDPIKSKQEAMARRLQRAASGITGEFAAPVINRQSEGTSTDTTPPPFSQDQVAPTVSKPWRVPRPFHCSWIEVELDRALLSTHKVAVVVDGHSVGSVIVAAGDRRAVGIVNRSWPTGTRVQIAVPLPGTGTGGQTVTLRGAMI